MKILVTGANGFLGRYFHNFNMMENHEFIWGSTSDKHLTIFEDCYRDVGKLKNIDAIIHFASVIPVSFDTAGYENVFLKNCEMMKNLIGIAARQQLKKFIYISSFGSMQNPKLLDIKDYYTLSKITGELMCNMLSQYGTEMASLRISSPYGEFFKTKNVINIFLEKAFKRQNIHVFGSGKRQQNFTYAGDIVNAIELCFKKKVHGVYNIVAEKNTSMLELARVINELTDNTAEIIIGKKDDPQERYCPEYSFCRAQEELGYTPQYNISEGLARQIKWLRKSDENSIYC